MFLEKCLHDASFEVKIVTSGDWTKGPLQRPLYEEQDHVSQLVTKTPFFYVSQLFSLVYLIFLFIYFFA